MHGLCWVGLMARESLDLLGLYTIWLTGAGDTCVTVIYINTKVS